MIDTKSKGGLARFLPRDETGQALAVTAAFALLRLVLSPFVGLGTNEAYAIASGRLMSLSYFDHPPLHFWLAHLGELLCGEDWAARMPFIALGAGASWLMFLLTRRLFEARAALWAVIAFNLSLFFSLIAAEWILPDTPLVFFLLAAALALAPLATDEEISLRRWLSAGALAGLGALSKYHALLFIGGFFCFLLSSPQGRRQLAKPGPWLAAIAALIVFSPVLIWNAQNDWMSFRFQGGRATAHHLSLAPFLSLFAAEIGLLSPWVFVPLVHGGREGLRGDGRARFLLWLGLPIVLLFTLVPLWSGGGMVQWPMPGWLMLLPLAGGYLAQRKWRMRWAALSAAAFLIFVALGLAELQTGWLGHAFPHAFRKAEPTIEYVEWTALADSLERDGIGAPEKPFVLAFTWRDAAKIDQALRGTAPVIVLSDDARNYALIGKSLSLAGRDAFVVARPQQMAQYLPEIGRCFSALSPMPSAGIGRGARREFTLEILRATNYQPAHCGRS